MSSADSDDLPLVSGALAGGAAWLFGYAVTYLLTGTDLEQSGLNRFIELFGGESATYELVGWVFYNAHFVDVTYENVGIVRPPPSFVGGEDGFTAALYLLPPALLFIAGLALVRYQGVTDRNDGAITGVAVVPGYLVLSIAGIFLFRVTVGDAVGGPNPLPAIVVAGVFYPGVFGAAGGAVGGHTAESESREESGPPADREEQEQEQEEFTPPAERTNDTESSAERDDS